MTLSLTMMVRDAAATLERAVESVRPYVDEVCIIDTGSEDGTQEIARRLADRYRESPWQGHFGKHRNETLYHATGDYVLIMDADHYAVGDEWSTLRDVITDNVAAVRLRVRNVIEHGATVEEQRQVLVLRRDPQGGLKYQFAVHHQIEHNLKTYCQRTGRHVADHPATLMHDGYDIVGPERVAKFTERLKCYDRALRETEGTKHHLFYRVKHAECLFMADRMDESIEGMRSCLDEITNPRYLRTGWSFICKAYLQKMMNGIPVKVAAATEAAAHGCYWSYDEPSDLRIVAVLSLRLGHHRQGIRMMARSYLMALRGQGEHYTSPEQILDALQDICPKSGVPAPAGQAEVEALLAGMDEPMEVA